MYHFILFLNWTLSFVFSSQQFLVKRIDLLQYFVFHLKKSWQRIAFLIFFRVFSGRLFIFGKKLFIIFKMLHRNCMFGRNSLSIANFSKKLTAFTILTAFDWYYFIIIFSAKFYTFGAFHWHWIVLSLGWFR